MLEKVIEVLLVISIILYIISPMSRRPGFLDEFVEILMVCTLYIRCKIDKFDFSTF